jgi:hypothetical protein
MAMALGRGGDIRDPEVRSIHQRLVNACRDSGTEYFSSSVAWEVEGTKNTGSRILTVSADRAAIFASFDLALKEQLKEDAND